MSDQITKKIKVEDLQTHPQPAKKLSAREKFLEHKKEFTDFMIRNNDVETQ